MIAPKKFPEKTTMDVRLRGLALRMFDIGVFLDKRFSPNGEGFKIKAHENNPGLPLSPYYLNFRNSEMPKPGPLTPELTREIGRQLYLKAFRLSLGYDCVTGIPNAGEPIAKAFAAMPRPERIGVPLLRMKKEEVGGRRRIAGFAHPPSQCRETLLLIDDVINKADTKFEAICAAEKAQLFIKDILVVIDREEGGAEELAAAGYYVHSLFKITELVHFYMDARRLDRKIGEEVLNYIPNTKKLQK